MSVVFSTGDQSSLYPNFRLVIMSQKFSIRIIEPNRRTTKSTTRNSDVVKVDGVPFLSPGSRHFFAFNKGSFKKFVMAGEHQIRIVLQKEFTSGKLTLQVKDVDRRDMPQLEYSSSGRSTVGRTALSSERFTSSDFTDEERDEML